MRQEQRSSRRAAGVRLVGGDRERWGPCTVEGRGPVHGRHNLGVGAMGHMGPELPGSSGLSMEARNLDFM